MIIPNQDIFIRLCQMIGGTPLIEISYQWNKSSRSIYIKQEQYNYSGSVKDRMALFILYNAYLSHTLKQKDTIVEATSGNTGISFAAIGSALGHKVKIFMPDWMSKERVNLIKSYGAEIVLISKEQGGFRTCIETANLYAKSNLNTFQPSQFSNLNNSEAHYQTTGPEIWDQLEYLGLEPDAFVAGVGTGGTVMGIGRYLKERKPDMMVCPLEPTNSPTLKTGHKVGKHRIEGISDEFIPELINFNALNDIIDVDDGDAIIMAQKIASTLGLGVGISSGANFLGAVKLQNMYGDDKIVVTLFPDDNKKYISTDLMKDELIKDSFLSPLIENLTIKNVVRINDLNLVKRNCKTCEFPSAGICRKISSSTKGIQAIME